MLRCSRHTGPYCGRFPCGKGLPKQQRLSLECYQCWDSSLLLSKMYLDVGGSSLAGLELFDLSTRSASQPLTERFQEWLMRCLDR